MTAGRFGASSSSSFGRLRVRRGRAKAVPGPPAGAASLRVAAVRASPHRATGRRCGRRSRRSRPVYRRSRRCSRSPLALPTSAATIAPGVRVADDHGGRLPGAAVIGSCAAICEVVGTTACGSPNPAPGALMAVFHGAVMAQAAPCRPLRRRRKIDVGPPAGRAERAVDRRRSRRRGRVARRRCRRSSPTRRRSCRPARRRFASGCRAAWWGERSAAAPPNAAAPAGRTMA